MLCKAFRLDGINFVFPVSSGWESNSIWRYFVFRSGMIHRHRLNLANNRIPHIWLKLITNKRYCIGSGFYRSNKPRGFCPGSIGSQETKNKCRYIGLNEGGRIFWGSLRGADFSLTHKGGPNFFMSQRGGTRIFLKRGQIYLGGARIFIHMQRGPEFLPVCKGDQKKLMTGHHKNL